MAGHILVVDDDDDIRALLQDALELEGYRVTVAEHGQAAWDVLRRGPPPCVILLDLMMPVMDGAAFRSLMLADANYAHIPVVLITAGGEKLASNVKVDEVLHKPFRVEAIVDTVRAHCH